MNLMLVHGKARINGQSVTEATIEVSEAEAQDLLKTGAWKDVTPVVTEAKKAKKATEV